MELVVNAVRAASAAPSGANEPKWWVHLVGVSAISTNVSATVPISLRLGPSAAPGMRPRRNRTARHVTVHSNSSSTGNRLASEPSAC